MVRLLLKFNERKLFAVITAGLYFAAVVLCHEEVSKIFDWMRIRLSFKVYNNLLLEVSILITLIFAVLTIVRIRNGEHKHLQIAVWLFTATLVVVSYKTLIVFNAENTHYLQYALLTFPVFALVTRYGETVFWVTFLGALDEAFQYFVLYPDRKEFYFDFNDIVLNLVGAGIGVAFIYTLLDVKANCCTFYSAFRRKWYRSPAFLMTAIISPAIIILYVAGLLKIYPGPEAADALIILSRIPAPAKFWTESTVGNNFHILSPLEGVVSTAIIMACYSILDRFSPAAKSA
jgi:VanZ family protein